MLNFRLNFFLPNTERRNKHTKTIDDILQPPITRLYTQPVPLRTSRQGREEAYRPLGWSVALYRKSIEDTDLLTGICRFDHLLEPER